jgi:HAD superfamily hydrolase (TIGR01484 family)
MTIAAVAFDLDDTLAPSKSPMPAAMVSALVSLLAVRPVCIISGGRFEQFHDQVLRFLPSGDARLGGLHLMPTCGTRYLTWRDGAWTLVYEELLSDASRIEAMRVLEEAARDLGLWESDDKVRGPRIEDRGSQITFSALGQSAAVEDKRGWDPSGEKRSALRAVVAERLPELEVRAGGSTSIDVTRFGIDKAHGITALSRALGVPFAEILFVGDRLEPGGNDYPVVRLGVQTHAVADWTETVDFVTGLLARLG